MNVPDADGTTCLREQGLFGGATRSLHMGDGEEGVW